MRYGYKEGKKRIESILDGDFEVKESRMVPTGDSFTFDNAYHSWVTAIFVDIRNSTELMAEDDQEHVAKVVRSFTSEIIEILRGDSAERELGIRGDCVYAVYSTPTKKSIAEALDRAAYINTYINMLNELLVLRGYDRIHAGIGIATGHDHVIKAGRKDVGINSLVWMGDAVSKASKLSAFGDKDGYSRIFISNTAYINAIEIYKKRVPDKNPESWFHDASSKMRGAKYCSIVMSDMDEWINDGMPD